MAEPRFAVILAAGGAGLRFGGPRRKQYLELAGEPILLRALRPFLAFPSLAHAVMVLPPEDAAAPPAWLVGVDPRVALVRGGAERSDSVRLGLDAVPADVPIVLVHDAARPLVPESVIRRALDAAVTGVAAVAAVRPTDTVKRVDAAGVIVDTPDRAMLRLAQTPQAFPAALLRQAHARAAADGVTATDDAALVERYGGTVVVVEGAPENLKVTRPADLALAEAVLRARA